MKRIIYLFILYTIISCTESQINIEPVKIEHEYVDFGLPSGTLWATCNLGASTPEDYGYYYAWGETIPKSEYKWSNYMWCDKTDNSMTKYVTEDAYGLTDHEGDLDYTNELELSDDAAHVNWGEDWRMPSSEQVNELLQLVPWECVTRNGVRGILLSRNNAAVFLPFAGEYGETENNRCLYWTRTHKIDSRNSNRASCYYIFLFNQGRMSVAERCKGYTIRPVRCKNIND